MVSKIFLHVLYIWKNKFIIIIIIFIIHFYIYQSLIFYRKDFNRSIPLILLYTYNHSIKTRDNICRGIRNSGHVVNFDKCPEKCEFSCRLEDFKQRSPDAVLFFGEDFFWPFKLTDRDHSLLSQRWIFWSWEAPINHPEYTKSGLTFNWSAETIYLLFFLFFEFRTMTYRQDSDIVHDYGRYIARNLSYTIRDYQAVDFYLSSKDNQSTFNIEKEFQSRQNKILWFVSNCRAQTRRHKIAEELNKYFPIDRYGECSYLNNKTNRMSSEDFEKTLFKYKFYLAFENANCQDYITEKAFYNALAHGSIPIVLGSNEENYKNILPLNSFIHMDHFQNLKDLTNELSRISQDLNLFKSYHQWRNDYRLIVWPSNYFIDDLFCNLCIKLYEDEKQKSYKDFSNWLNKCK